MNITTLANVTAKIDIDASKAFDLTNFTVNNNNNLREYTKTIPFSDGLGDFGIDLIWWKSYNVLGSTQTTINLKGVLNDVNNDPVDFASIKTLCVERPNNEQATLTVNGSFILQNFGEINFDPQMKWIISMPEGLDFWLNDEIILDNTSGTDIVIEVIILGTSETS